MRRWQGERFLVASERMWYDADVAVAVKEAVPAVRGAHRSPVTL